jgi:DNA-directed RNA polymerase subunit beta'
VIVGRLIPAGTGFDEYRDTFVVSPKQEAQDLESTDEPVGIGQETQQKVETGSTGA